MKSIHKRLFVMLAILAAAPAGGQTLNWGSELSSRLVDSEGETLDHSFIFELGAFQSGFVPDESNVDLWLDNWLVFDRSEYNAAAGYFGSTVQMQPDGTSDSIHLTPGAPSFEGLEAYLWIRNGDTLESATEWFLAHSVEWVFPAAELCGCGSTLPLSWSVSDLADDLPQYGSQGDFRGPGEKEEGGSFTIQTHTFAAVPEPGVGMLAMFSGLLAVFRRRRAVIDGPPIESL